MNLNNSNKIIGSFNEKCDFYFSRVLNKPPKKPEYVIIDVTHKCNLKCVMCDIRKDTINVKELTTDEIKYIIDQCIDWRIKEVVLSGGEPFVREDILGIIEHVKRRNFRIGILTNGVLLNQGLINKIRLYLLDNTVSLTVSLDGYKPETHDKIRGMKGSYNNTFNLLKKLSDLKKKNKISFSVISIVLNENLEELPKLINLFKELNVDSVQFQPLLANNLTLSKRSTGVTLWIPEQRYSILNKTVNQLIKLKQNNKKLIVNTIGDLKLIKKYFEKGLSKDDAKCYAIFKTMLIANDGKITACNTEYGNIRKRSLKESWFSKEAEISRELIKNCEKPCLLPCFTDFNLLSISKIGENFLEELEENKLKVEDKVNYLKEGLNILNRYGVELLRC